MRAIRCVHNSFSAIDDLDIGQNQNHADARKPDVDFAFTDINLADDGLFRDELK